MTLTTGHDKIRIKLTFQMPVRSMTLTTDTHATHGLI